MRFSAQVTTMSIAAMLLLCGCEHHESQETMLTTAVSVSEAIQSEAETSVTAETASDTSASTATEPPAPLELIDGMLIYSQDFDDFADSTGVGLKIGAGTAGYIDNLRMWYGWGDEPSVDQETYAAYRNSMRKGSKEWYPY